MKKAMKYFITVVLIAAMVIVPVPSLAYEVPEYMEWWQNDKFGMFIHLGAYSYYGQGEWVMSEKKISKETYQTTIAANFNPTEFDAGEIVKYAKEAGMKYIVITAKHHEGFSLWDTKVESFKDYTGTKMFSLQQYTPFGTERDILMELKEECEAAGLKFGLYYSIIDWNHSSQEINKNFFTTMSSMEARESYISDMKAQLKELVTLYDPAVIWFDGDWLYYDGEPTLEKWWTKADGEDLYHYMKEISPEIIVNERVCRGYDLGDFECPEQTIPSKPLDRPWETCQTMNGAWGYKESKENSYSKKKDMVRKLVTVASRGGNFLLNIGPKGDGSITKGSIKILKGFRKWMSVYGESIYGTTQSPFKKEPKWGLYTQKDTTIYAHVFRWPKDGKLTVKISKKMTLKGISFMDESAGEINYTVEGNKAVLTLPKEAANKTDTVIVMEYE